jgi:hypothetical protein
MTSTPPPGGDSGPDGSWGYQVPDRSPSTAPARTATLDPLSRRLLKVAAGLSALLILVVAFAWLHGSDEASLNPIAEAAARTQEQPGSRIAMRGIYTMPTGQSMTMHGSGLYNARTGRSRLAMELTVPGLASPLRFDAVGDKQTMYMRSTVFTAELPPGDRWLATQEGLGNSAQTSLASNSGSEGQLEMLRAAGGKVEDLGEETVRGVATTRYRGTVDLNRYADMLREEGKATGAHEYEQLVKSMPAPIPVEAWLDDGGLVRRMRMVMDIPSAPGAPTVKMDLTMEFFDFGIAPKVDLPTASETFDATPLGRAQLHLLDGSSVRLPSPPASAAPLAPSAFRSRASAICNGLIDRMHRMKAAAEPLMQQLKKAGGPGKADPRTALQTFSTRYFEPAIRVIAGTARRLAALSPPAATRADFRELLHLSTVAIEINEVQARALDLGSMKGGRAVEPQLQSTARRIRRLAHRIGIDSCGDGAAFGPSGTTQRRGAHGESAA